MIDSHYGSPEGQDSVHGGNNHLLESTLARMASYFERQENRTDRGERGTIYVEVRGEVYPAVQVCTRDGEY